MNRFALTLVLLLLTACSTDTILQEEDIQESINDEKVSEYGIDLDQFSVEENTVRKGDFFSTILDRYGVSQQTANQLAEVSKEVFDIKNIQVGKPYHAYFDSTQTLVYLMYEASDTKMVLFSLQGTMGAEIIEKPITTKVKYQVVNLQNSLWADIQSSGTTPLLALKLSDIYAWTIDFFGLQKGDSFEVVYEEKICEGKTLDIGNVFYAAFEHSGKTFYAFYYDDGEEDSNKYWNENGESMRKAFLKAPLNFSRISSGFSYARKHPISKVVKAHTGVDYAAAKGTPVMSIGDGVVTSAKYEGAGGNTIRITHNSVYKTAYLHLSKYATGIKAGARVSQGQVIGYVGSTGSSTGPHLDFRVWKNGSPINPLKMESPPATPVPAEKMAEFQANIERSYAKKDSIQTYAYYRDIVLAPLNISFE